MVFRKGFTFSEIPFIWGLEWDLTVTFICTQVRHCSGVEKKKHNACTHMCFYIAFYVKKLMRLLLL